MCSPCPRQYRSSRCDKHNCPRRDSNLDPLTPQSDALTTRLLTTTDSSVCQSNTQVGRRPTQLLPSVGRKTSTNQTAVMLRGSACGRGNAVGLTLILDRGQFSPVSVNRLSGCQLRPERPTIKREESVCWLTSAWLYRARHVSW